MLFITALNIIAFACHHIIYSHCSFSFANRCCSRVLLAFSDANTIHNQWITADSSQGQGRKMLLELVWVAACHQFFTVGSLVILVRWFEYYFYFIVPQLARWCLQVIHNFFFFFHLVQVTHNTWLHSPGNLIVAWGPNRRNTRSLLLNQSYLM